MIINGKTLLEMAPIRDMLDRKVQAKPTSYGLTECGYDIRLKEDILFDTEHRYAYVDEDPKPRVLIDGGYEKDGSTKEGRLVLGSSMEYFHVPNTLMGRVLNKSTWARKGLDASMTTNIEPGWRGHLTIELIYHGQGELHIPAGSGICQVIFERVLNAAQYEGKYQDQEDRPVEAVMGDPRHPEYLANQHRLPEWHAEKRATGIINCKHNWLEDLPNLRTYCTLCGLDAEDMLERD